MPKAHVSIILLIQSNHPVNDSIHYLAIDRLLYQSGLFNASLFLTIVKRVRVWINKSINPKYRMELNMMSNRYS
jgi:hypothetical protein